MVSAGLDTVPGNLIMGIAYLSSPNGQEIQKRAYEEIMKVYPSGDAWERCLVEEKVPYVTAFVREVLRFFTVIPICLPRTSIKDITYEDAVIPAGTTFYMVRVALPFAHFGSQVIIRMYRTLGRQITTPHTSNPPPNSPSSATSLAPKAPEHHTTPTARALACAPDHTSQTASSTLHSSAS